MYHGALHSRPDINISLEIWCNFEARLLWLPCFHINAIIITPLSEPQAQVEAQKATQEFQRAVEILRAAKETIALAEERLLEEDSRQFDSAWQEMLNHATQRVRI